MSRQPLLDPVLLQERMEVQSLPDLAYRIIRQAIVSGRFKPGTWLRQRELAQELGMGISTVREALKRLSAEGYVVVESHKGFRTAVPTPEYMQDHGDVIVALEQLALELAVDSITPEELTEMRQLLPRTDPLSNTSVADAAGADREFHMIAIRASGRPYLIRILEQTWDKYHAFPWSHYNEEEIAIWSKNSRTFYPQLIKALEARDVERVRDICARTWEADMRLDKTAFARISGETQAE